jgi:hypothetical protein
MIDGGSISGALKCKNCQSADARDSRIPHMSHGVVEMAEQVAAGCRQARLQLALSPGRAVLLVAGTRPRDWFRFGTPTWLAGTIPAGIPRPRRCNGGGEVSGCIRCGRTLPKPWSHALDPFLAQ